MLIFFKPNLVLFATPKTGSTAYHMALRKYAEIALVNKTTVKHLSVRDYERHLRPFLKDCFDFAPESVAMMRDPLEHLRSWYRYRKRSKVDGTETSTLHVSFDAFIEASLMDTPPPFARVGYQASFLLNQNKTIGITHLFAYENLPAFHEFLEHRLERKFATQPFNLSPEVDAEASPDLVARFRQRHRRQYAIYDRLQENGGYLHTPVA